MKARSLFTSAGIAGALAVLAAAPVFAQGCPPLCLVSCLKPIAFADRWDDVTPIAGYTGGGKKPNWQNNGRWDAEAFTDSNANGLWDPGEDYTDGNANAIYDAEAYHSLLTGYIPLPYPGNLLAPDGDLGLQITLQPGSPSIPAPGQYVAIDFPALNRGTPVSGSAEYSNNWATCNPAIIGGGDVCQIEPGGMLGPTNQAMRDIIALDPGAYWDPGTSTVLGSAFGQSPRIIMIPLTDPRVPMTRGTAAITKVIAFFMEQMVGNAAVQGRLTTALGSGQSCATAGDGFVLECPTSATPMTWGRVKGIYR